MKKINFRFFAMLMSISMLAFAACDKKSTIEDEDTDDPAAELEQSASMDKPSLTLSPGDGEWISVIFEEGVTPQRSYSWHSSDEEVVSVEAGSNHSAKVTAKSYGSAVISYRSEDGEVEASCTVEVPDPIAGYLVFDEFTSSGAVTGWVATNMLSSFTVAGADSYMLLTSNTTAGAHYRKYLDRDHGTPFQVPFSYQATFTWTQNWRANNVGLMRVLFKAPETNPEYPYLEEIHVTHWGPGATAGSTAGNTYRIRYGVRQGVGGTLIWSGTDSSLPELITPTTGADSRMSFSADVYKTISFSLDEDYVFYLYIDGTEWFQSDAIKQWLTDARATYPGFADPVGDHLGIQIPARANTTDNTNRTYLKLKSVYLATDGRILK